MVLQLKTHLMIFHIFRYTIANLKGLDIQLFPSFQVFEFASDPKAENLIAVDGGYEALGESGPKGDETRNNLAQAMVVNLCPGLRLEKVPPYTPAADAVGGTAPAAPTE
jgi:hypothetical protein